ncbi:type II toxin-antitoxin system MqsA family antitoxin [Leclercia sp.]|uniref:type II toxin-antitoxin system MqsA family antitoxin n=1 Tax=Leclercia sp. TaxID=1898428 RepID=UPI0028A899D0|nr:type II toxin-antitoxin system MqsA family antitoxin [Leclercia sp.]
MKCPVCGGAELQHESRDIAYEYKGQKTIFHAVKGQFCDACDEIIFSNGEGDEYFAAIIPFPEGSPCYSSNLINRVLRTTRHNCLIE